MNAATPEKPLTKVEEIKTKSNFLRGTIADGLADTATGAIAEDDTNLLKFHGMYQQDDRDLRIERKRQNLEKAFIFMIRVRVPGGVATPDQWLMMDELSETYGNKTLKLTTRQAFQLHGLIKKDLRKTIQGMHSKLMDSIAACGDVNRNVMCNPDPEQSEHHQEVFQVAKSISEHLLPRSKAYYAIWLEQEKVAGTEEFEPIYGKTYLPRKFKIGVAIPPSNDVDIFSQDLGFIAIIENNKIVGYNVTAGGGLGTSHGQADTYPRLADVLGFVTPDQVLQVSECVVTTQRDYGDRTSRKHARLKYTIDDKGVEWFKAEVEKRMGFKFQPAKAFHFDRIADRYGWNKGVDGKWSLTLFIQNGRVKDTAEYPMKSALREIARIHDGDFRLTSSQNLIIAKISDANRPKIEAILKQNKMDKCWEQTGLRLNSLACVALPTCGLSLAESERYLPDLIKDLEKAIDESGLHNDAISIRMTGCPNGCARPYLAEIGLIGRAPGKYNVYLGAKYDGSRLNTLYKESLKHDEIVNELSAIIKRYAQERTTGEGFGDFCIRAEYVKPYVRPQKS